MPRVKKNSDIYLNKNDNLEIKTATPSTEVRVLQVAKMICEGKSRRSCIQFVQDTQGVCFEIAKKYYNSALRWLLPKEDEMDEYKQGLIQANMERLESIVEDCVAHKDDERKGADYLRTAKEAIAEMNKMLGIGSNKIQLAQNKEGDQMISIEFN